MANRRVPYPTKYTRLRWRFGALVPLYMYADEQPGPAWEYAGYYNKKLNLVLDDDLCTYTHGVDFVDGRVAK